MDRLNKQSKQQFLELLERFDLESWANMAATEGRMIEKQKQALEKIGTLKIEMQKDIQVSIESEKN